MRYLFLVSSSVLLIIGLAGCRSGGPSVLDYKIRTLNYLTPGCQPEEAACLMVNLVYPEFHSPDSLAAGEAARQVYDYYFEILGRQGQAPATAEGLALAVSAQAKIFDDYLKDFPDALTGWQIDMQASEVYRNDTILVLAVEATWYFGGAHPNSGTRFYNLNRQTGRLIPPRQFIGNEEEFTRRAEKLFRQQYGIADSKPWEETRFMFAGNRFALARNIAFAGDSVLLHYDPYDIASYADGAFELAVPLK